MNEFIAQFFAAHALPATKTYLGRASIETTEMLSFVVNELCQETPTAVTQSPVPRLELFIKLNDPRFSKVVAHLTMVAIALEGRVVPFGDDIETKLAQYVQQLTERSAECKKWQHWHNAFVQLENGDASAFDAPLDDDMQTIVEVFETMLDCGVITERMLDNIPTVVITRLGVGMIKTRL